MKIKINPLERSSAHLISSHHHTIFLQPAIKNLLWLLSGEGTIQHKFPCLYCHEQNKLEYMHVYRHTYSYRQIATSIACIQWTAPPQWNIIHWYSGQHRQNGCCMGSGVGKNTVLWQKLWRAVRLNNEGNWSRRSLQQPWWQPVVWLSGLRSQSLCVWHIMKAHHPESNLQLKHKYNFFLNQRV